MSAKLGAIPPGILVEMLEEADWYRFENYPDCPTSPAERQQLLECLDWNVFKVIVGAGRANGWQLSALMARLEQLSGFGPLRRALQERFFERSDILRCLRTISTAFDLLSEIQFGPLLQLEQAAQFQADRLNRFLGFIQHANGDNGVRRELAEFV